MFSDALLWKIKAGIAIAMVVLIAVLAGTVEWQRGTIRDLDKKVSALELDNQVLNAEVGTLSEAIKKQSAAVLALKMESELRTKEAMDAIAAERQQAQKWRGKYNTLLNAPKPAAGDCEGLSLVLEQYIATRKDEGR